MISDRIIQATDIERQTVLKSAQNGSLGSTVPWIKLHMALIRKDAIEKDYIILVISPPHFQV